MSAGRPGPVLAVENLRIDLQLGSKSVPAVEGVNFSVAPGEILGIVGESGSGKSLTALSIMKMLPAAASVGAGKILLDGTDISNAPEDHMRALRGSKVGMIFQDPLAFLNPLMTVGEQLGEALTLHGVAKSAAKKRAVELLASVDVRDPERRVNDYPHEFSGGMRQRVVIAMAIANGPRLLIADEPTTALDVTVQANILRLLRRLRDELGAGLILITHDIGVVKDVCDSVVVMYAGRVVERGHVDDVLAQPRHPYTAELTRSTPRLDQPLLVRLPSIPGQPPDPARRPHGCAFHPRCKVAMPKCSLEEPLPIDRGAQRPQLVACWAADRLLPVPAGPAISAVSRVEDIAGRDVVLDISDAQIRYARRSGIFRRSDDHSVVDGVSLQVRSGQAVGLVGESGCGKSTLARAIVGLLPLAAGRVCVDGLSWTDARRAQRALMRRRVQMVFQDTYQSLNPRKTIRQTLAEPLTVHEIVGRSALDGRIAELFDIVGLPTSLTDRYPYQLSGGQRQRVGLARALAMEPKLIVADEPVSALDVSIQAQIINLLADLKDRLGIAYLFIAHDLSVVRQLCEVVAVMQKGRIVEVGDTDQIFASPRHPYTASLLAVIGGSPLDASEGSPR